MVDLLKNLNLDNRIYHDDIDIDTDIEYGYGRSGRLN